MATAEEAYAKAQAEIARVIEAGGTTLDLSAGTIGPLETLPPEIGQATSVTSLGLVNTKVADLSPLAQMTGMMWLSLGDTQVADLSPLAQMTGMTKLFLSGTQVADLSPLAQMTGMKTLYLDRLKPKDFGPAWQMTKLERLSLSGTPFADLGKLQNLPNLRRLWIDGTQVTDLRGLLPLSNLENGHYIGFRDTPATQADPKLAEIAKIYDDAERTRTLYAYLREVGDDWPPGQPANAQNHDADVTVPVQVLAPVEVAFEGDRLALVHPTTGLDEAQSNRAKSGWQALRDYIEDLEDQRERIGNAMPRLAKSLGRLDTTLSDKFEGCDPILLGVQGHRFIRIAETAPEILLEEDAADIAAFAAALALYLERFPEWIEYKRDAQASPPDPQQLAEALPQLREVVDNLKDREGVDQAIPDTANDLADAFEDDPSDGQTSLGLLRSGQNIVSAVSEKAVQWLKAGGRELADIGSRTWTAIKATLATSMSGGILLALDILFTKGAVLAELAVKFPGTFGFVQNVLKALGIL